MAASVAGPDHDDEEENSTMHVGRRIATATLALAATTGLAVTSAPAAQAAQHRQMIFGSTLHECQISLNNAYNTYLRAGKPITGVDACVRNKDTASGYNNYYGSVLWAI